MLKIQPLSLSLVHSFIYISVSEVMLFVNATFCFPFLPYGSFYSLMDGTPEAQIADVTCYVCVGAFFQFSFHLIYFPFSVIDTSRLIHKNPT